MSNRFERWQVKKVDQVLRIVHEQRLGLKVAAGIMKGKGGPPVRMYVYPARQVMLQAMYEGIMQTLSASGAIICSASCGPCFGSQGGLLGSGEVCISSTNRNFKGRMGSPDAKCSWPAGNNSGFSLDRERSQIRGELLK